MTVGSIVRARQQRRQHVICAGELYGQTWDSSSHAVRAYVRPLTGQAHVQASCIETVHGRERIEEGATDSLDFRRWIVSASMHALLVSNRSSQLVSDHLQYERSSFRPQALESITCHNGLPPWSSNNIRPGHETTDSTIGEVLILVFHDVTNPPCI